MYQLSVTVNDCLDETNPFCLLTFDFSPVSIPDLIQQAAQQLGFLFSKIVHGFFQLVGGSIEAFKQLLSFFGDGHIHKPLVLRTDNFFYKPFHHRAPRCGWYRSSCRACVRGSAGWTAVRGKRRAKCAGCCIAGV